jgi:hypothetical protein
MLRGDHDSGLFGHALGHRIDAVGQLLPGCIAAFAGVGQRDFGVAPKYGRHDWIRTSDLFRVKEAL